MKFQLKKKRNENTFEIIKNRIILCFFFNVFAFLCFTEEENMSNLFKEIPKERIPFQEKKTEWNELIFFFSKYETNSFSKEAYIKLVGLYTYL